MSRRMRTTIHGRCHAGAAPKTQWSVRDKPHQYVVARGIGVAAVWQIIWRRMDRRSRVLVVLDGSPRRIGPLQRLMLRWTEGVLASPGSIDHLVQLGVPKSRIVLADGLVSTHSPHRMTRRGPDAHRILYVGELSPNSGAAEFLSGAIAWADRNPDVTVELLWLGRGDLTGILQAQLLPANLTQVFEDLPLGDNLEASFAQCGLLVVPNLSAQHSPYVTAAMAAGLPILASKRCSHLRGLIEPGKTGWLFDPLSHDQTDAALTAVLRADAASLDDMRAAAMARIALLHQAMVSGSGDRRLWPALLSGIETNHLARV